MAMTGASWLLAPGLLVPLGFGHDAQTTTLALLPATLLAGERVLSLEPGRPLRLWLLALAFVAAWQVLGGHPQFVVYTGVALAAMLLGLAGSAGHARRLGGVAGALAFAAALSAVAWWPAILYSFHTQRTDPAFAAREARIWSLLPRALLSLAWPSRSNRPAGGGLGAGLRSALVLGPLGEQWLDWARHAQEDRLARHLVRDQAALERFVEAGPAAATAAVKDLALELGLAGAVL